MLLDEESYQHIIADNLIKTLADRLLLNKNSKPKCFHALFQHLTQLQQRKVLYSVLQILSDAHLNRLGNCTSPESRPIISAAAFIINSVIGQEKTGRDHLITWLTNSTGTGVGDGVGIRRAVLAVVAQDRDGVISVLEKSIRQFGDQLYVKLAPMLQQEGR
jgi:telomere length regulation protein